MRRSLRGAVGLAAVGLLSLAALPSAAAPAAERKLLGITIWRSWQQVLALHGSPTRIEVGAVSGAMGPGGQNTSAGGPTMPGMPGLPGMSSGMSIPGMGGSLPGLPGMGPSGPMGMAIGGRRGGGEGMEMPGSPYAGYGSAGGMGGPPGAPMASGSRSPGGMLPGMSSGMSIPGMSSGMSIPGMSGGMSMPAMGGMPGGPMGGMGGGQASSVTGDSETTWVYEKGANTNYFLFNKDGRVIQIQAYGYKGSAATARGLRLGDPVSKVYRLYGWPDSSTRAGNNLTLDYSRRAHAAFQLTDLRDGKGSRVVGITVALTEKE